MTKDKDLNSHPRRFWRAAAPFCAMRAWRRGPCRLDACRAGHRAGAGAHQVAPADLFRRAARRARHQAADRRVQRGGQWRDGDRALLRRPAGADGRAVPRHAERHHRRRAVGRRDHGLAGRHLGVRRLLPVRHALQPRCAGAVQLLRPERDLGRGLWRGRERDLAVGGRLGPASHLHQGADPQPRRHERQARVRRADGRQVPVEIRPRAGDRALGRRRSGACRPASSTASPGAASPKPTKSAGPMSATTR